MTLALQTSGRILRQLLPLAVLGASLAFLWPMIEAQDRIELASAWQAISPDAWVLAAAFTLASFLAIGQYDVIAHRQLDTGMPAELARQSGMAAIALSQTIGFGLLTGTLSRWRLLRGYGPGVAALVTAFVSLTFLGALTTLTAIACIFLPSPHYLLPLSSCVILLIVGLLCVTVRHPRLSIRGFNVELPSLRAVFAATGWAALDMGAACLALWVLIPEAARPDILAFLPAFCLALSAGLFSGTPAGAGPFELVLLALCSSGMPAETDTVALLVAVVAFRIVYFALPACLAGVLLVLRPSRVSIWRDPEPPFLRDAPRAETAVIRQNGGTIEHLGSTYAALWPTGQALVSMFDPFDAPDRGFFACLADRARDRNRFALVYKAGARTAQVARESGWVCLHSADDAVVDVANFDLNTPARAGLRRKLRKASRSGVSIRSMLPGDLPRLSEIDLEWQASQGEARGGSMGRFCADYLAGQRVLVAETDGRLIAFVSFQTCRNEWALDLMRQSQIAPDGTMHALVHAGIEAARRSGVGELSLAAVPACPDPSSAVWRHVAFRVAGMSRSAGLRQFKSSFAPRWKPLYTAAPSRLALVVAGLDVAREVFMPNTVRAPIPSELSLPHDEDEIYDVATEAAA